MLVEVNKVFNLTSLDLSKRKMQVLYILALFLTTAIII